MAMNKPDDLLNISEVVYNELIKLGFSNIRNAQIGNQERYKTSLYRV